MYLNWNVNEMTVAETEISIDSEYLKRKVTHHHFAGCPMGTNGPSL